MASISAPTYPSPSTNTDRNPIYLSPKNPKFVVSSSGYPPPLRKLSSRASDYVPCRCQNRSDLPSPPEDYFHGRWDSLLQETVKSAIERLANFVNSHRNPSKNLPSVDLAEKTVEDWDWDRWMEHFNEIEEQEKIISILKSQVSEAVYREDYKDAARLKVAIAAAATNDTVGRVISHLNRAVEEEHYQDAAYIRDYAGAGLVGWWAGFSKDSDDPYGQIIRISAEHGRYVARGYSPRQLATATPGAALFEIFLTTDEKGEYKQQVVYLKWGREKTGDSPTKSSKLSDPGSGLNPLSDSTEGKSDLSAASAEDLENSEDRDDDSDVAEGLAGFQNILQDMIPGIKLKVLKVTAPGKVDMDVISKVIEQIMEEDEEKDFEVEGVETDDEVKAGSDQDQDEIEMDDGVGISDNSEEENEIAVKVVIGGQLSDYVPSKDLIRVPARLEKRGRLSFLFSIDEDVSRLEAGGRRQGFSDKSPNLPGQRNFENVMSDLAKFIISREKIPMKVLKDVGELISLTLSQAQNRQPLSGSTIFNRIEVPVSSDPLNGIYIGAHGIFTSEVIHLRRKFGQWQEDGVNQKPPNLEFYEYVEALKLTGDPYVPAGQVAFRAKVGKQYQLPHKGIIPEELGVIARYKGQGRLAEPGFLNPRWVDGELVILDGKYIKGGPVVGFVYWAPEYRFLVFFNRLRLQE